MGSDDPDEVADLMITQKILRNGGKVSISTSRMTIDWDELLSKEMIGKAGFYQQKPIEEEVSLMNDADEPTKNSDCKTLLEAVRANDLAQVKTLLKSIDPNCVDPNPDYEEQKVNDRTWRWKKASTPLVAAARGGFYEIGQVLTFLYFFILTLGFPIINYFEKAIYFAYIMRSEVLNS